MHTVDVQNIQDVFKLNTRKIRSQAKQILLLLGRNECELSIVLCDNRYIQALNKQYLGKDNPTNVISFPQQEGDGIHTSHMGDIVISVEKANSEAKKLEVSMDERLCRLLIHGICHLSGYNHENVSNEIAKEMSEKEEEIFFHIH